MLLRGAVLLQFVDAVGNELARVACNALQQKDLATLETTFYGKRSALIVQGKNPRSQLWVIFQKEV